MFLHNLKYALLTMLKTKSVIIWTLLFPMALGTFMYMAFGDIFDEEAMFDPVKVAVVKEAENESFEAMFEVLSKEGDDKLLNVSYLDDKEAKEALEDESVSGIIYVDDEISLTLKKSSYEGTILESVLNEYLKQEKVFMDIVAINTDPIALEEAVENLTNTKEFCVPMKTSNGNQDVYTNFFYSIFAMSCMFASFGAIEKISNIQANVSSLGMRRCVSPTNKLVTVFVEFLSMLIVQFIIEGLVLLYFNIIGIDFGTKYVAMLGILLFGSCIGIAIGIIIGSFKKLSEGTKTGLCILIGMVLSVLADLVAVGVKHSIEQSMPIINRLNPAALIADSFYALNIYDTYDRYFMNMSILAIMSLVLLFISYLILRRNKYESV